MLKSVMIVDDTEADRYIAKWSIKQNQIADLIFEARDGEEAMSILASYDEHKAEFGDRFPPTLILLDVNMPKMNGFEFLKEFEKLRALNDKFYDSVVVMMFTSSQLHEDKERTMGYDFVRDYLVKPVDPESLKSIIDKHF